MRATRKYKIIYFILAYYHELYRLNGTTIFLLSNNGIKGVFMRVHEYSFFCAEYDLSAELKSAETMVIIPFPIQEGISAPWLSSGVIK